MIDLHGCFHGGIYSVNPSLVKFDFSSNVNPLGVSKIVLNSIQKDLHSLSSSYPDPECKDLIKGLSDYLKVRCECINVGNGATDIIHNFARMFARKKVIIPSPSFCEYELASSRTGASLILIPLKNFKLDADQIIEKAKGSDAIFLCNPNNPTGLLYGKSLKTIIERLDSSTKILVDECFIELVSGSNRHTMIRNIDEFDNLIILRSLTKSFGLAGLRLGYSVSNPRLAKKLASTQISWSVNGIAQRAGIVALKDPQHLTRARAIVKKERDFMYGNIRRKTRCFWPFKSDTNYFLIRLQNHNSSTELRDSLLANNGVLVRDCSTFSGMGSKYIRVAVKNHEENITLLNALESVEG
ncbi:MAG TPA: histidinol-phosphate transaminase [Candidatus Nitrosopolaris sp.]|nr:histidinol-phosphate transaminase [Candidatus Nitrosopolaris sp.]